MHHTRDLYKSTNIEQLNFVHMIITAVRMKRHQNRKLTAVIVMVLHFAHCSNVEDILLSI